MSGTLFCASVRSGSHHRVGVSVERGRWQPPWRKMENHRFQPWLTPYIMKGAANVNWTTGLVSFLWWFSFFQCHPGRQRRNKGKSVARRFPSGEELAWGDERGTQTSRSKMYFNSRESMWSFLKQTSLRSKDSASKTKGEMERFVSGLSVLGNSQRRWRLWSQFSVIQWQLHWFQSLSISSKQPEIYHLQTLFLTLCDWLTSHQQWPLGYLFCYYFCNMVACIPTIIFHVAFLAYMVWI